MINTSVIGVGGPDFLTDFLLSVCANGSTILLQTCIEPVSVINISVIGAGSPDFLTDFFLSVCANCSRSFSQLGIE